MITSLNYLQWPITQKVMIIQRQITWKWAAILRSTKRRHFQWPWMTLNPSFKVTSFFDAISEMARDTESFNGMLIGTYSYTRGTPISVSFRMILSDLAKYSVTRRVARSLCDSWASLVSSTVLLFVTVNIYGHKNPIWQPSESILCLGV